MWNASVTRRERPLAPGLLLSSRLCPSHPFISAVRFTTCAVLTFLYACFRSPEHLSPSDNNMKPPMQEELEDDLAAEEENKLINEVCRPLHHSLLLRDNLTVISHEGIQNLVSSFDHEMGSEL